MTQKSKVGFKRAQKRIFSPHSFQQQHGTAMRFQLSLSPSLSRFPFDRKRNAYCSLILLEFLSFILVLAPWQFCRHRTHCSLRFNIYSMQTIDNIFMFAHRIHNLLVFLSFILDSLSCYDLLLVRFSSLLNNFWVIQNISYHLWNVLSFSLFFCFKIKNWA